MIHRAKVWTALGTIYVLWGSTYLGIELTGETIPPLLAAAVRFVLAGLLMAGIATWRRGPRALKMTRREVASCALVGLLLPGANAMLFLAERRVPTGLSSLIIGSVPLWVVLMRTITGDRPPPAALVGVGLGFGGLVLLVRPGGGASLLGLLLVVGSAVTWATGAFLSGRLPLPADSLAATAVEMLTGGLVLLPLALAAHPHVGHISARSIAGFVYLVTFGSLIGYTAFVWLLDNAPIQRVATYAYVNPIVAIGLGALVLHETISWRIGLGAAIVLASVAIVVRRESVPAEAEGVTPDPRGLQVEPARESAASPSRP